MRSCWCFVEGVGDKLPMIQIKRQSCAREFADLLLELVAKEIPNFCDLVGSVRSMKYVCDGCTNEMCPDPCVTDSFCRSAPPPSRRTSCLLEPVWFQS